MNNEPIHFLPVNKFWEKDKQHADQRALWMLIGIVAGTVGTLAVALAVSKLTF